MKCLLCGKEWVSVQSLRSHMRVHKNSNLKIRSVLVDIEKWDKFVKFCRAHGLTTCHLIDAYLSAITAVRPGVAASFKVSTEGIASEIVTGSNPLTINFTQNLNQTFLGKPRSSLKVEIPVIGAVAPSCRLCGSLDIYEWTPEFTNLLQGRCRKCGVEWLIGPMP